VYAFASLRAGSGAMVTSRGQPAFFGLRIELFREFFFFLYPR